MSNDFLVVMTLGIPKAHSSKIRIFTVPSIWIIGDVLYYPIKEGLSVRLDIQQGRFARKPNDLDFYKYAFYVLRKCSSYAESLKWEDKFCSTESDRDEERLQSLQIKQRAICAKESMKGN